jgi:hypothetical protein
MRNVLLICNYRVITLLTRAIRLVHIQSTFHNLAFICERGNASNVDGEGHIIQNLPFTLPCSLLHNVHYESERYTKPPLFMLSPEYNH